MSKKKSTTVRMEDIAIDVELERKELSFSYGEARPRRVGQIGKIDIDAVKARDKRIMTNDEEIIAIRKVVEKFENLPPSKIIDNHGILTTDPYTSISMGEVDIVDRSYLNKWIKSPKFSEIKKKFSGEIPHSVEFVYLNIMLVDEKTASVQYRVSDMLPTGETLNGNSSLILVKEDKGDWRINVFCQHPVSG